MFREDGYINATKAAQQFGKRDARYFFDGQEVQAYLEALSRMTGIPVNILRSAKRGKGGGTWLHPKLAVKFACWLSVEFEAWCHLMIDNILHGNIQTVAVLETKEVAQVRAVEEALRAELLGTWIDAFGI